MYKAIVCSYNEPKEMLHECLKRIQKAGGVPILVKNVSPVGKARNVGLRQVDEDYIFFVDVDELVPPNYFRSMVDFLEKSGENIGGVWALHVPPRKNSTFLQRFEQRLLNYFQKRLMNTDITSIGCGGSCFKKQAIEGLFFNENVETGEDAAFCERMKTSGWKLKIAPVEVEHAKPKNFRDWVKSEIGGGIGYVQVEGSLGYSLKRLFGSPIRGLMLTFHYHDPVFFFLYPLRLIFWYAGILKAVFALRI